MSVAVSLLMAGWIGALGFQEADEHPAARWESAIQRFEDADHAELPDEGQVLFVGSSSIRRWPAQSFPNIPSINRGFGGSQISDVNFFFERVVAVYRPKVIVFYAGDNDIARERTPEQVIRDFDEFLEKVREHLDDTHVVWLPIKPSLERWEMWPKMQQVNEHVTEMAAENERLHTVNLVAPMIGDDGRPREELFADDGLHLNERGYQLWSEELRPVLAEVWRSVNRGESP